MFVEILKIIRHILLHSLSLFSVLMFVFIVGLWVDSCFVLRHFSSTFLDAGYLGMTSSPGMLVFGGVVWERNLDPVYGNEDAFQGPELKFIPQQHSWFGFDFWTKKLRVHRGLHNGTVLSGQVRSFQAVCPHWFASLALGSFPVVWLLHRLNRRAVPRSNYSDTFRRNPQAVRCSKDVRELDAQGSKVITSSSWTCYIIALLSGLMVFGFVFNLFYFFQLKYILMRHGTCAVRYVLMSKSWTYGPRHASTTDLGALASALLLIQQILLLVIAGLLSQVVIRVVWRTLNQMRRTNLDT